MFGANGTSIEIRKLEKGFAPRCQWTRGNLPVYSTDVIKSGTDDHCMKTVKFKIIKIRTGCQFVLILQLKPKLSRTKDLTGLHVAGCQFVLIQELKPKLGLTKDSTCGPRLGHSCARALQNHIDRDRNMRPSRSSLEILSLIANNGFTLTP